MDWARAIEINQTALTRIVSALIALVGLSAVALLPRPVYRAALNVLRPAELAVRRLIVIAARGVVVTPHTVRSMPAGLKLSRSGCAQTSFQLFDSRKRFAAIGATRTWTKARPRIFVFGVSPLVPLFQPRIARDIEPEPDGMADAARLGRRLLF